ncbi:hypothetical protein GCM10023155_08040 [Bremerella cremea]
MLVDQTAKLTGQSPEIDWFMADQIDAALLKILIQSFVTDGCQHSNYWTRACSKQFDTQFMPIHLGHLQVGYDHIKWSSLVLLPSVFSIG